MRRFWSILGVLLILLVSCGSARNPAQTPNRAFDGAPNNAPVVRTEGPVRVSVVRSVRVEIHGDVDFSADARRVIQRACSRWKQFTHGNADITPIFDVDFSSASNLHEHQNQNHNLILGIVSDGTIAKHLDEITHVQPHERVIAVTTTLESGAKVVYLIGDRIPNDEAESVVIHELGHVLGLKDLPFLGALMSGTAVTGLRVQDFTQEDAELCRASHLCW
jgi:hypothetical protein